MRVTSAVLGMVMAWSSWSASAEQTLTLSRDKYHIGNLKQHGRNPASKTVKLVRTSSTPDDVYLTFGYAYQARVCAETGQRWVPGNTVCYPGRGRYGRFGGCHSNPGRYETYCIRHEWVDQKRTREIKVRFKRTSDLHSGETETFLLTIQQEQYQSDDLDISGEAIETKREYRAKEVTSFFRKRGFEFVGKRW